MVAFSLTYCKLFEVNCRGEVCYPYKIRKEGDGMKIQVRLSEAEFFRFSWFDVLHRRRVWCAPVLFAAALCTCAVICFIMSHIQGAAVLGAVLLAVGAGIPAAYFLNFFISLRKQARDQKLGEGKYVYTLELEGKEGLRVDNGREHAVYPWGQIFHAYRDSTAVYLYITPQRAFLIPYRCVAVGADKLWALLKERLPEDRMSGAN